MKGTWGMGRQVQKPSEITIPLSSKWQNDLIVKPLGQALQGRPNFPLHFILKQNGWYAKCQPGIEYAQWMGTLFIQIWGTIVLKGPSLDVKAAR